MKIAAGQFKAKCLKIMDDVHRHHKEVIITKYNKPIVKLVPFDEEKSTTSPFGFLKGTVIVCGNIIKPIEEKWNVDGENF